MQDAGFDAGVFKITNNTGYDIWYLYILSDEMRGNKEE